MGRGGRRNRRVTSIPVASISGMGIPMFGFMADSLRLASVPQFRRAARRFNRALRSKRPGGPESVGGCAFLRRHDLASLIRNPRTNRVTVTCKVVTLLILCVLGKVSANVC